MSITYLHDKKPGLKERKVAHRTTPASCLKEVTEFVTHLERKVMANYDIKMADVDELAFRVSMAEEAIEKFGEHWYEKGKAERGLFDG